jgi:hypothetical protein
MRKFLSLLADIRKDKLNEKGAPSERLASVDALFREMDRQLDFRQAPAENEQLAETLVSADFPYALEEYVNREMVAGYMRKGFAFEPLVYNDTLSNFLPHTRYQNRQGFDDLEYVGQKGQARPGTIEDATKRQYQVYRWEKQIDFSWEALVNDDLGYLEDTTRLMGEAARRTLEKFVSRMYTNAVSIAAMTALGALYSTTGRLTTARISAARMAFNQRTDAASEPINARLDYLVIHSGLVDTARTIQNSELVPELATNAANVVRPFTFIEDPYITGTAPNLPWWAFCVSSNIRPFVLARLQGWTGPRVARKASNMEFIGSMLGGGAMAPAIMGDFDTGNIVLKVVDIFGTYIGGSGNGNYFDVRGGYYSAGTAP